MVAYKKNALNGAETDFSKIESRELPQFMKQNLASTCFFRITPYLQLNWLDWKYEPRRSKKKKFQQWTTMKTAVSLCLRDVSFYWFCM